MEAIYLLDSEGEKNLKNKNWWIPNISSKKVEEILKSFKRDSFIICNSNEPNSYCCSVYNFNNKYNQIFTKNILNFFFSFSSKVTHHLIHRSPSGKLYFSNSSTKYDSLEELITNHPTLVIQLKQNISLFITLFKEPIFSSS